MRISEYTLLEEAFHNSFGFMLNRLADLNMIEGGDPHADKFRGSKELAEERCWNEFMCAIEEMGVELEDAKVAGGRGLNGPPL